MVMGSLTVGLLQGSAFGGDEAKKLRLKPNKESREAGSAVAKTAKGLAGQQQTGDNILSCSTAIVGMYILGSSFTLPVV